ncbi:MAG: AEC family transporter, partial [Rectinema sp.]|nr:AEC family transporter [Rectinema sp.]
MIYSRVASIFLLIVLGYVATKRKVIIPAGIPAISDLVLYVTLPFTIITGFDKSIPFSIAGELLKIALLAFAVHLIAIGISTIAYRKVADPKRRILSYVTVFSNCGFMGFPVAESVFGKTGLMFASIYVVVFNIFIWTWGIALFSGGKETRDRTSIWKRVFLNPGTIAVIV